MFSFEWSSAGLQQALPPKLPPDPETVRVLEDEGPQSLNPLKNPTGRILHKYKSGTNKDPTTDPTLSLNTDPKTQNPELYCDRVNKQMHAERAP